VRRSGVVRTVERSIASRASRTYSDFDLDLSAFEPAGERIESPAVRSDRLDQVVRPSRVQLAQRAIAGASNRGAERTAERVASRKLSTLPARSSIGKPLKAGLGRKTRRNEVTPSKLDLKGRAENYAVAQSKSPRKTDHLQAKPSPEARKEKTRDNCKQRPQETKGSGRSRAFVPWCKR